MTDETDSEKMGLRSDSKMVLVKFPVPLLREVDDLRRFNCIGRSEFIIFAVIQLLDYMDRKVGMRAEDGEEPFCADDYGIEDEDVLEAAEDPDGF